MGEWQPIETAPRDGTPILLIRDNGCGWDYALVWWNEGYEDGYPWRSQSNAYPEDRLDYWMPLPPAPESK